MQLLDFTMMIMIVQKNIFMILASEQIDYIVETVVIEVE